MAPQIVFLDWLSSDITLCWNVLSSNGKDTYLVSYDKDSKWLCDCPDYYYRKRFCKHMRACAEANNIKDTTVFAEV